MNPAAVSYYLYYPENLAHGGIQTLAITDVAARVNYWQFINFFMQFEDLGEINPSYTGLKKLPDNFILIMAEKTGLPLGFCVFKIHKANLVEIDIVVVRRDLRRLGLGRILYSHLEQSFPDGTAFFVENTTFAGSKFFKSCGFFRDVDLIKVLKGNNRLAPAYKRDTGNS
jgi:ribosomal protein S18 acetylase RimI-like enzyme